LHKTGISVVLPVTIYSFIILSVPTDLFFLKKRPLNNNIYVNKSVLPCLSTLQ
jgi:hypothetical protein